MLLSALGPIHRRLRSRRSMSTAVVVVALVVLQRLGD
jgi:hypothetical protein